MPPVHQKKATQQSILCGEKRSLFKNPLPTGFMRSNIAQVFQPVKYSPTYCLEPFFPKEKFSQVPCCFLIFIKCIGSHGNDRNSGILSVFQPPGLGASSLFAVRSGEICIFTRQRKQIQTFPGIRVLSNILFCFSLHHM